mmetsp:Transcript_20087/g.48898  ORF Transcript_20087/g.48898 Transcript_20087/m.48898 type:complete len:316 (+) Transcript_20087:1099-2046(+)
MALMNSSLWGRQSRVASGRSMASSPHVCIRSGLFCNRFTISGSTTDAYFTQNFTVAALGWAAQVRTAARWIMGSVGLPKFCICRAATLETSLSGSKVRIRSRAFESSLSRSTSRSTTARRALGSGHITTASSVLYTKAGAFLTRPRASTVQVARPASPTLGWPRYTTTTGITRWRKGSKLGSEPSTPSSIMFPSRLSSSSSRPTAITRSSTAAWNAPSAVRFEMIAPRAAAAPLLSAGESDASSSRNPTISLWAASPRAPKASAAARRMSGWASTAMRRNSGSTVCACTAISSASAAIFATPEISAAPFLLISPR